jgi:hypothetical protein
MWSSVDAELDERALVDQQRQPLARGQLLAGVLGGDLLRSPAELDLLSPRPKVIGERGQQGGGGRVGRQRSLSSARTDIDARSSCME